MDKELLSILLRPIAKFCVRRSIKLQTFTEVMKNLLVSAAEEELSNQKESVTSSRLSVMTGVHRKDVKSILEQPRSRAAKKNIIARVIGQWRQSPKFTTQNGRPKTLTVEGNASEFAQLVNTLSVDLNPYTVLFELERIQAVERTNRGVRLVNRFYQPVGELKDSYQLLSNDLSDLIFAVDENIHEEVKEKHLHLKTEYDKVPTKYLSNIKKWLLKEGTSFHQRAQKMISKYDADINPSKKDKDSYSRIAIGSFSYSESSNDNKEKK